jgi:hypothetical protein
MTAGLCAAFILAGASAAGAIDLSQKGQSAFLSGPINDGDEFKLRDFLASEQGRQIKVIFLNSPGGRIIVTKEMARHIRNAGLTTVVDAAKSRCNSACTGLFTAGIRRLYINAGGIADGIGGRDVGLGFHEANSIQANGSRGYSGVGVGQMNNIYYEMGVPGAARLVTQATFNKMFKISGQTALSSGIATALSLP